VLSDDKAHGRVSGGIFISGLPTCMVEDKGREGSAARATGNGSDKCMVEDKGRQCSPGNRQWK
jgi:hypothetical protein